MEIITTMILISIQPFAPKRVLTLFATLFGLAVTSCFAAPSILLPVESTPYDRQMTRIRPVLTANASAPGRTDVSLALVNHWMEDLRDIPYGYQLEWRTPEEVQSRRPADCKGKAVTLYQRMQAHGAKNVRLVIGKRAPTSKMTHAWLVWETKNGSYLLDPTFNWMAWRSEQVGRRSYVPLYAYAGAKKFRATSIDQVYARN